MSETELLAEITRLAAELTAIAGASLTFTGRVTVQPSPEAQRAAARLLAEIGRQGEGKR